MTSLLSPVKATEGTCWVPRGGAGSREQAGRRPLERLAGRHAAGLACRVKLVELKQPDALRTRLDQQAGVAPGRLGRVLTAQQQHTGKRLAEARRPGRTGVPRRPPRR